ncbi:UPF0481 protein At3g47200-like [Fagus crenata]
MENDELYVTCKMCSQANSWAKFCLLRIRHYLKEGDAKLMSPRLRLRQMGCHKWCALHHVLKRTNHDIYLYLDAVKELEERAHACYEGPVISLGSNEFVEMMVLDGCFVIELFKVLLKDSSNWVTIETIPSLQCLPLFILDRILGLQLGNPDLKGVVAKLALHFFNLLMPTDEPLTKNDGSKLESSLESWGLHCLDDFRRSLLRRGPQYEPQIWIKRWSHNNHIKFKNGIFKIPRLLIHDGTKSLFLNLIAYEQCHLDCGNDITSYEDVGHLHYHGIIEHWLGSDAEVADLFNRLCQEVLFDINDSYLSQLLEDVNRYYDHKWNAWCASLRHNYFNNPWAIISLVAAVFLLMLTFTQTFYGVYLLQAKLNPGKSKLAGSLWLSF